MLVHAQGGGPPGGNVLALAIDPTNPTTLYAGTGGGGVFKSTNGGTNWTAINSGLTNRTVNVLAIDPATPTTLYAGTGQVGNVGGVVFKSINGGTNWTAVGFFGAVTAFAIDPAAPATLYAGSYSGLYKSTDGGTSWTRDDSARTNACVQDLAIDPSTSTTLYAGCSGVFRSTSGGANWISANSGLGDSVYSVLTLAIAASTPATLYAGTRRLGNVIGGVVFKSTNGGTNWNAVGSGLPHDSVQVLAIDSSNPLTLYAGTHGGAFKSTDGGMNWTAVNSGLTNRNVQALAVDPSAPALYAGTGAGVSKSTDGGTSWNAVNSGLTNMIVSCLTMDPLNPATLYAGTNSGGVFKSTDGGMTWTAINEGLTNMNVTALAIDPLNPATLYAGTAPFDAETDDGGGVFRSTNGGMNWTAVNSGLTTVFVSTLTIDRSKPKTLYAGTAGGGGLFKSSNGGLTWTAILVWLDVYALAIDPSTPSMLYAGTSDGIYKSTNGGASWTLAVGFPGYVYALAIDPSNPATLYAGIGGGDVGVVRSTNAGANWSAINSGLPALASVLALAIDRSSPTTVYAGTFGAGIFKSTDTGTSWQPTGASVTPSSQSSFAISNRGGVSWTSSGSSASTNVGFARIQPNPGNTTPAGVAIFGFRQNHVLVSETGVPASLPLRSGRIYVETNGPVETGLAMANPNNVVAMINFFFTDTAGNDLKSGTTTIVANGQVARFLDEAPFNGPMPFQGTFSFTSNVPVGVIALRGFANQRGEFLMSTLPVIDTTAPPANGTQVVPHYADGGGWTTQILLVNPTSTLMTGNVQFSKPDGTATNVTIAGQTNTTFAYSVPPRTSQKLSTAGITATTTGSLRVVPAGGAAGTAPVPLAIFSYKPAGITVSEAGVPATNGTALRMYVESSGASAQIGNIQSGIAVANASSSTAAITFELTQLDGSTVLNPVSISLAGSGQTSKLVSELFPTLPNLFKGVVRITTTSGVSAVGLRLRYNERGEYLITTTPLTVENSSVISTEMIFPHLADGGGFTTQFILFSGTAAQFSSGNLLFYSPNGQLLDLPLQ